MSRPILPARMAVDSVEEIKGFVSALLYSRKSETADAIVKCLFQDDPIVKGPFVSLSLPFVKDAIASWPLDPLLNQGFAPYAHQIKSFHRLSGNLPRHTLVTTGTGSGKSECFILPLMDYVIRCKRAGKRAGVKALIMYPMNALIEDQGERLSEIANKLNESLPENQLIRIGRYTGGAGKNKTHNAAVPKQIIDDRETLCEQPPDILLTNYKMLDFMLFRPEEQSFWDKATQEVFRYLVLDELHTFDGAQGADVACLIRRLRLRLSKDFTCVGTSATVSGGGSDNKQAIDEGRRKLCEFAGTLFGTDIGLDAVIGEERVSAADYLTLDEKLPTPKVASGTLGLLNRGADQYDNYLSAICDHWLAPHDPIDRGTWVRSHPLTHRLMGLDLASAPLEDIAKTLDLDSSLLVEFLDLLASSRMKGQPAQVLNLSLQLWSSDTGALLRRVGEKPEFRRYMKKEVPGFLPAVHCQSCGASGWITLWEENPAEPQTYRIEQDPGKIFPAFFSKDIVILFAVSDTFRSKDTLNPFYFDADRSLLVRGQPTDASQIIVDVRSFNDSSVTNLILHPTRGRSTVDRTRCPQCDESLQLGFSSVSQSMLTSILTSSFLANGANPDDRKLLVFNDSVQDSAHQSAYISARSYRFNVRRLLLKTIQRQIEKSETKSIRFNDFRIAVVKEVALIWDEGTKAGPKQADAKRILSQLVSKDLWERWQSKGDANPLKVEANQLALVDRLQWEFWMELTLQRNLGWSLMKSGLVQLSIDESIIHASSEIAKNVGMRLNLPPFRNVTSFVQGFYERLANRGSIFHPDLAPCYASKGFSLYRLTQEKPHLIPILSTKAARPQVAVLEPTEAPTRFSNIQYLTSRKNKSWFENWLEKNLSDGEITREKSSRFWEEFSKDLLAQDIGLFPIELAGQTRFVCKEEIFQITLHPTQPLRCDKCAAAKSVSAQASWNSLSCDHYLCSGLYRLMSSEEKTGWSSFSNFLKNTFVRDIEAPLAHTHNSSLGSEDRRLIEQGFKRGLMPGDSLNDDGKGKPFYLDQPINILSCTPTLEMGIDIGSLSGVILRGFPRTLSNTVQRLGRSGRKSGNAFNIVMTGRGAHDLHFWKEPDHFFKGKITPPGCKFRTRDLLRRQFHAFLLDSYVSSTKNLSFPSEKNTEESSGFAKHPYWDGFKKFLQNDQCVILLQTFLGAIKLGPETEQVSYADLSNYLTKSLDSDGLWSSIESVLVEQDNARHKSKTSISALDSLIENHSEKEDTSPSQSKGAELLKQRNFAYKNNTRSKSSEYVLSILASKGILPNYAFPETGIQLRCSLTVLANPKAPRWQDKYRVLEKEISRPSDPGLRELAPGSHFYLDSIKAPIVRIGKDDVLPSKLLRDALICEQCGHVSEAIPTQEICPVCEGQTVQKMQILSPQEVFSTGEFDKLQLHDSEDEREKSRYTIEPFINFSADATSEKDRAAWVSGATGLSFEFRTQATINLLVRGPKFKNQYQYFNLCEVCWAVPYARTEDEAWVFQAEYQSNRHASFCSQYSSPNGKEIPIVQVALGRQIKSDTIRFSAGHRDRIPTLSATLLLAMRLRLGGQIQHLGITITHLNTDMNGPQVVATLYDKVPGGTGHLRSLMPFIGEEISKNTSGHTQLKQSFEDTKRFLKACGCEDGCYDCLLNFDNQYHHENISKSMAIQWLGEFIEAHDWQYERQGLDAVLATHTLFDSQAEQMFADAFLLKNPPLIGQLSAAQDLHNPTQTILIKLEDGTESTLVHTAHERQYLPGGLGYTLPDFGYYRDGRVKAYIYIDGADPHLSPKSERSVFIDKDIALRTALRDKFDQDKDPPSVLTFTYDMVKTWTEWLPRRSAEDFKGINSLITDVGGTRGHKLLSYLVARFQSARLNLSAVGNPSEMIQNLYRAYVTSTLSRLTNPGLEPFLSEKDIKVLLATLPKLLGDGKSFGCMTVVIEGEQIIFEIDDAVAKRVVDGKLNGDFKESWSVYWMMWSFVPSLFKLRTAQTSEVPKVFSYLSPYEKSIVQLLWNNKLDPVLLESISELDDSGIGAPFARIGKTLCFIKQGFDHDEEEIDAAFRAKHKILLLDSDLTIEENIAIIKKSTGKKS